MDRERKWESALRWAAPAAVLGLTVALAAARENSYDLFWHLAAGRWILGHHAAPRVDMFSFLREGAEWIDAQWLFQVMAYGAWRAMGNASFTVMTVAAATALLAMTFVAWPGVPRSFRALTGLFLVLAVQARFTFRPELITCLGMAGMFLILERVKERWIVLIALPLIQLLWVNSHGLWPIGIVIVACYLGEALWAGRKGAEGGGPRRRPGTLAAALALMLIVCLAQPYGIKGLVFPLTLLGEITSETGAHKQSIVEFQSLFGEPPAMLAEKLFCLMALGAVVVTVTAGRRMRPLLALLGLVFGYMAFSARRNVGIGGVALAEVALAHLAAVMEPRPEPTRRKKKAKRVQAAAFDSARLRQAAAGIAALVSVILMAVTLATPRRSWDNSGRARGFGLDERYYPEEAAAFLQTIRYQGNIINNDRVGGILIFYGWPEWKVMADPRMEIRGEESLREWRLALHDAGEFRRVAERFGVEAVVVDQWEPYLKDFAQGLLDSGDWMIAWLDRPANTIVFLKRTPRWEGALKELGRPR